MQEMSSFLAPFNLQKLSNECSSLKTAANASESQVLAQKPFREILKEQWREECLQKKRSLLNFLSISKENKGIDEAFAEILEDYKVPKELMVRWPDDKRILELFQKNTSRFELFLSL